MQLSDLVGRHRLSGIEYGKKRLTRRWGGDAQYIRFCLDGTVYEATEDPDDGYRSYLSELETVDKAPKIKLPDCPVICKLEDKPNTDVLVMLDAVSKRKVLSIGTDYTEDWYPCCVFCYNPENLWCNHKQKEAHE